MSLATVMYHYVLDDPNGYLGRIPHITADMFRDHLEYMFEHGQPLKKGESLEDFVSSETGPVLEGI